MEEQWYVWLVGSLHAEGHSWGVIGVFSSREKALEAASSGDFITILIMDDAPITDQEQFNVEWVE